LQNPSLVLGAAMNGQLTIVGMGIGFIGNLTLKARSEIELAEKVFYLVTDELSAEYITNLNLSAESLHGFYSTERDRIVSYGLMVDRIMAAVRAGVSVCAIFYGHPGIFVYPSHECIVRARREGYAATMLPAVSAEDCLFADIGIDPGRVGCQSFEANDFLIYDRVFDPRSVLVLWQIGVIGEVGYRKKANHRKALAVLRSRLLQHYPKDHIVVLYEATEFPTCDPVIESHCLQDIEELNASPISTLVIPPRERARPNLEVATQMGIPPSYVKSRAELDEAYDPLRPSGLLQAHSAAEKKAALQSSRHLLADALE
jgi:tetrapyrrole (corrin/porphyrin) methylase-like protein